MTISHRLSLALTASILAAAWAMPASATDLPAVPAVHKAANLATPAKRPARQSLVRIASADWPLSVDAGPRWLLPVILGVAY
jgi:hypothetical protein